MLTEDTLDLRRLPIWERASTVLERSDALESNGSFDLLLEFDPRALIARLEQLRPGQLSFSRRNVGEGEWRITLTRVHVDSQASSLDAALTRSPIFSTLSRQGRMRMLESFTESSARKGQTICAENAASDSLGVLLEGALAVFVGAGSRERLLFHLYPFDVFGEIEYFDGGLSLGRTTVLSKTARIATITYGELSEVVRDEPDLLRALAARTAQHNRTLASALAAQVSQPILSRVASALLPYAPPERGLHPAFAPLPTMTQAQVAAAAGTVKEVAARAIAELERIQALRRERGHVRFLDRSKLLETIDQA
jgi:uncharacterized protein (DUF2249 family)/CRP-like cAMP-binding protein